MSGGFAVLDDTSSTVVNEHDNAVMDIDEDMEDEWAELREEELVVTMKGHMDGGEEVDPNVPIVTKKKKMPTIQMARAVARSRRAELRRQLLLRAHCEHTLFLQLSIYYLKTQALKMGTTTDDAVCAVVSTPLVVFPEHPHLPPPINVYFDYSEVKEEYGAFEMSLQHFITTAESFDTLSERLLEAGYMARPVVGLYLNTAWAQSLRKVGRFYEAAADAAILGRPPPHVLGGEEAARKGGGYRGHRMKRTAVKPAKTERRKKRQKKEEDLFSFESSEGAESSDSDNMVAVTVDAMLDAEKTFMEKQKSEPSDKMDADSKAQMPWDPDFLKHEVRNPVDAVIEAHNTETALRIAEPTQHDLLREEWLEVLFPDGHWRAVLPGHLPHHHVANLSYVLTAYGGAVLDLTSKYCSDMHTTLGTRLEVIDIPTQPDDELQWSRTQIGEGEDGDNLSHPEKSWLKRTIKLTSHPYGPFMPYIENENEMLRRLRYKCTPPASHRELLKHRVFCAKSLLAKIEVIHPDAVPVAKVHSYHIFARDDVSKLRGREAWKRFGRTVKPNESCIRKVAAAAGFGGTLGGDGKRTKEVFAHWQTKPYTFSVESTNGKIWDGNGFNSSKDGSVSLADCPLPDNLVHIKGKGVNTICSALKVSYGKALVSFTRMGGFSRPNFDGVVVAKEHEAKVRAAVAIAEAKRAQSAAEKKSNEVVSRWEDLTRHLLTRLRLREKYM